MGQMENKLSPPSHLASCEQTESTVSAPWALLLPVQKIPSQSISDIGSVTSAVLTVEHVRKPHTLLIVSWNNLLGNKKSSTTTAFVPVVKNSRFVAIGFN